MGELAVVKEEECWFETAPSEMYKAGTPNAHLAPNGEPYETFVYYSADKEEALEGVKRLVLSRFPIGKKVYWRDSPEIVFHSDRELFSARMRLQVEE